MLVLSFFLLLAVRDISADTGSSPVPYSEAYNNQTKSPENKTNKDLGTTLRNIVKQPQVIIAFLMGIALSATVCCLATLCQRKKQTDHRNMVETLEMVTTEADPLMETGKSVGNNGTCDQGAAAAGQSEPKEAEYSDIDFSRWSRKNPPRAEEAQEATETEYAEIKRDQKEDTQDVDGEEGEKLEGDEQEVAMVEEEEEKQQCGSAEEAKGEEPADGAMFSALNDETEDLT